jgi:hypothetical protein
MEHLEDEWAKSIHIKIRCIARESTFPAAAASRRFFHRFPGTVGWTVLRSGQLISIPNFKDPLPFNEFIQTWLFFGLIFTVLRDQHDESLLSFEDLRDPQDDRRHGSELHGQNELQRNINTKLLPSKLKAWADWETSAERDAADHRMRMIHLDLILEKARRVIQKHCSYQDSADDQAQYSESTGNPWFTTNEMALSLMVLGETLTQVKRNIMTRMRTRRQILPVPGWFSDDEIGWGQPRLVIEQMLKGGWCLRTQNLMRKQLGNSAILLLNAYHTYKNDPYSTVPGHDKCTPDVCFYIYKEHKQPSDPDTSSSEESQAGGKKPFKGNPNKPEAVKSEYKTAHHYTCLRGSSNRNECKKHRKQGPATDDLEKIILEGGEDAFPMLQLVFPSNGRGRLGVKVVSSNDESIRSKPYATISHVWSHGFGNETANKLWSCQLQMILDIFRALRERGLPVPDDTPFWWDTLAVPYNREDPTDEQRQAKELAVSRIIKIYNGSAWTLFLDRHLLETDHTGQRTDELCNKAIAILASGWIKRLWTLQEAYMSTRLIMVHKATDGKICTDYDELCELIEIQARDETCSVAAGLVERQLKSSLLRNVLKVGTLQQGSARRARSDIVPPPLGRTQPSEASKSTGASSNPGAALESAEIAMPEPLIASSGASATAAKQNIIVGSDNGSLADNINSSSRKRLIADSWKAARWRVCHFSASRHLAIDEADYRSPDDRTRRTRDRGTGSLLRTRDCGPFEPKTEAKPPW